MRDDSTPEVSAFHVGLCPAGFQRTLTLAALAATLSLLGTVATIAAALRSPPTALTGARE